MVSLQPGSYWFLPPGPELAPAPVAEGGKDGGFGSETSGRVGVAKETGPVFPLDFPDDVGSMTPPGPIRLSVLSGLVMPGEFVGAVAGPLAVWATAATETNIAAAIKNVAIFMSSSRSWILGSSRGGGDQFRSFCDRSSTVRCRSR
jgi:hypothetical protein